jgi:hypothetical protein
MLPDFSLLALKPGQTPTRNEETPAPENKTEGP